MNNSAAYKKTRKKRELRALSGFKEWFDQQQALPTPKSDFEKAIAYTRDHWAPLHVYLQTAGPPHDNNENERALRAAALGSKPICSSAGTRLTTLLPYCSRLLRVCWPASTRKRTSATYLLEFSITKAANPAGDHQELGKKAVKRSWASGAIRQKHDTLCMANQVGTVCFQICGMLLCSGFFASCYSATSVLEIKIRRRQ